jgi:hypothetical protein
MLFSGDFSKGIKRKSKDSISQTNSKLESKFETDSNDDDDPKKKKVRTTFTGRQIFELEKMFETKKYLSSSERADMAKLLNVTEQQVRFKLCLYKTTYLTAGGTMRLTTLVEDHIAFLFSAIKKVQL